jgi:hypothetical protein
MIFQCFKQTSISIKVELKRSKPRHGKEHRVLNKALFPQSEHSHRQVSLLLAALQHLRIKIRLQKNEKK